MFSSQALQLATAVFLSAIVFAAAPVIAVAQNGEKTGTADTTTAGVSEAGESTATKVDENPGKEAVPSAEAVDVIDTGDTAWILTSTALVLFMTIPALALFYGGLVRSKNILSVLMHCLIITAVVSIIWVLFGYSFAFSNGGGMNAFLGGGSRLGLDGVAGNVIEGQTIPEVLFVAFQMTFAIITPALIIGAFAERMKFAAVVIFSAVWLIVVYLPICHMTWGGGLFGDWHVKDFAGGIVVHVTAGFAALVACVMVGPRHGFPSHLEPPHSTVLTLIGTGMLWVGWFGFNGGSALGANEGAAMAMLVTHVSASVATIVWMSIEWVKFGKPSVLGAATGSIAGLAAITPAAGSVGPVGALVIGAASAAICFFFATAVKQKLKYDDSLDVFGVHGVGGFLGTILCGVFAHTMFGGSGYLGADGEDIGMNMANQVGVQLGAACITAVYTVIATVIILKLIQVTVGLRVDETTEVRGLDLGEHEERGYIT